MAIDADADVVPGNDDIGSGILPVEFDGVIIASHRRRNGAYPTQAPQVNPHHRLSRRPTAVVGAPRQSGLEPAATGNDAISCAEVASPRPDETCTGHAGAI